MKSKSLLYNLPIIALTLFLFSAFIGLLIRWNFTFPIDGFTYKNFLQAHSHVAFLGWGYIASLVIIIEVFQLNKLVNVKVYKILISIITIVIFLMLISFYLVGYKAFSVVLLSIFGIASYVISYKLLKDLKEKSIAVKLIRFGIYYYLLSSLATWFLGYVMVTQGRSVLFYNTIYFYLHFLYNGYFVFVLFGLLFKVFEIQNIQISTKNQRLFFIFLNIACVPAYFLSILWSKPNILFNYLGFFASLLQLISLIYLIKIIINLLGNLKWDRISKLLMKFALISYGLKVGIQIISSIPYVVINSLALKHYFIIGYLHLFTLGFMSVLLFLLLIQVKKINLNTLVSKIGMRFFLLGIIGTEFLLFFQGFLILKRFTSLKYYNLELFVVTFFLFIGLFLIVFAQFLKKQIKPFN